MRSRVCRLVLLLVAMPLAASAQSWRLLDSSPFHGYRFEDAAFVSPEHGWIVNGDGETWETQDGGASWALRSEVPGYLRSTAFPSATLGWIGVLFNVSTRLYETRDGGATMVDVTNRIQPAIGGGVCGLFALDETYAFGVGEWDGPAYFIKTTDGGQTWQSRDMSAYAASLIDVRFTDPMNGIVVGGTNAVGADGQAIVLATSDGGETWTERFRSSGGTAGSEWAWKLSFPTDQVGYVSVEYLGLANDGKLLKTTDGGLTWTELAVPGGGSMQGVGFINEDIGWTSGRGTDMLTTDGGLTWAPTFDLDGSVNRFEFFGDSLGFAMGERIYQVQRVTTTSEPTPADAFALSVSPSPATGPVTVSYRLGAPTEAEVLVFDALGRRVAVLHSGPQSVGEHRVSWSAAVPGVYLARLATSGGTQVQRFVIAR
ncbi:MAG: T9SS type A sorting domain-containing protein [Bacteroidota bacterium]